MKPWHAHDVSCTVSVASPQQRDSVKTWMLCTFITSVSRHRWKTVFQRKRVEVTEISEEKNIGWVKN